TLEENSPAQASLAATGGSASSRVTTQGEPAADQRGGCPQGEDAQPGPRSVGTSKGSIVRWAGDVHDHHARLFRQALSNLAHVRDVAQPLGAKVGRVAAYERGSDAEG